MTGTPGSRTGTIVGDTRRDAAIALAGALAERGIQSLELDGQPLATRVTDLPGLLAAAADGSVLKITERAQATIAGDTIVWHATDTNHDNDHDNDLAEALAAISSAR
ncbi:MAG: hypothetical protein AAFY58_07010 [Planctomycetota bacterium]